MPYAIIEDGRVANIVEADPAFAAEQGWKRLTAGAGIGWTFFPGINTFAPPDTPAPSPEDFPLTDRKLRLGLLRLAGITDAAVRAKIALIPDADEREEATIYWDRSTEIRWEHPQTQALIALMGISTEAATNMWMVAKDYE